MDDDDEFVDFDESSEDDSDDVVDLDSDDDEDDEDEDVLDPMISHNTPPRTRRQPSGSDGTGGGSDRRRRPVLDDDDDDEYEEDNDGNNSGDGDKSKPTNTEENNDSTTPNIVDQITSPNITDSKSGSMEEHPDENDKTNNVPPDTPSVTVTTPSPTSAVDDDTNDENDNKNSSNSSSSNNNNAIDTTTPPGTHVAKYFDGDLYFGVVDYEDFDEEGEKLWHIVYDDGDEEDFHHHELQEAIQLYQQEKDNNNNDNTNKSNDDTMLEDTDDDDDDEDYQQGKSKSSSQSKNRRKERMLARRRRRGSDNVLDALAPSSSEDDDSDDGGGKKKKSTKPPQKKKRRRKMMSESMVAKKAQAAERERERELRQWRRKKTSTAGDTVADGDGIVINEARPDDEGEIKIDPFLSSQLKTHQVEGVRFLWDSLIHSITSASKDTGRGAILAHSMGLGKSLQVVTFLHTILLADPLPFRTALVLGPKNTLYNWWDEFHKWQADEDMDIYMVDPSLQKTIAQRNRVVKKWHDPVADRPSILLMSYDQFKLLVSGRPKGKMRKDLQDRLLNPGPDIAVLDEGHIIANTKTTINSSVMQFNTNRRLILTGTPLSNNLREYHSMVTFVHHDLLSSEKEFRSRFVLPIEAGQYMDASDAEVKMMKRRVHVLNQKLKPIIHRRGYEILEKSLPAKYEYILSVRLTSVQKTLYKKFLERRDHLEEDDSFFHAWHSLQRIWNHPRAIEYAEEQKKQNDRRALLKREMDSFLNDDSEASFQEDDELSMDEKSWHGSDSENDDGDDDDDDNLDGGSDVNVAAAASKGAKMPSEDSSTGSDRNDNASGKTRESANSKKAATGMIRSTEPDDTESSTLWWKDIIGKRPEDLAVESGKFQILKQIISALKQGDKIGIFSQSLAILNLIENWLDSQGNDEFEFLKGVDLLRIDGSTSSEKRQQFCSKINDMEDPAKVMLVSVRAGALGINLVGINKLVLFDTSFNPTHDVQAIFRAYRFGQTRPVSIYRLVSAGTMEERIYRRQIEKRALFSRVVDEHQIERHFSKVDVNNMISLVDDDDDDEDGDDGQSRMGRLKDDGEAASKHGTCGLSTIRYKTYLDAPPKDLVFGKILMDDRGSKIPRYHEHDSLLDHKEDEELTEEEKKDAWAEFERAVTEAEKPRAATDARASNNNLLTRNQIYSKTPEGLDYLLRHYFQSPYIWTGELKIVAKGRLGIQLMNIPVPAVPDDIPAFAVVGGVDPGGLADQGGIRKDDVLFIQTDLSGIDYTEGNVITQPGTDRVINFHSFVAIIGSVRPLVFRAARRV